MISPRFHCESYFPKSLFHHITDIRIDKPEIAREEAGKRQCRERLTRDGRLVILAADHPGRGVTAAGTNPLAMADRHEYLGRILRVLSVADVDGVMSTPDILEELLLINYFLRQEGRESLLDGKVIMGCMNRGGISGAIFEMCDRFGAFTAQHLQHMRFDAAKMMFRLDWSNPDSGTTIQDCAEALRELEQLNIPAFLEPLPVRCVDGKYRVQKEADPLIGVIGIATALGGSSLNLWLKIPYVEEYSRVAQATTCPILMLGGKTQGDPVRLLNDFAAGLAAAPNIRGALVGRNILFPGEGDPAAMAMAVAALVHHEASIEEAVQLLNTFEQGDLIT